jgi:hypothetical protein
MSKIPPLDQASLLEMMIYDPVTGNFYWRHRANMRPQWNSRYAGKLAGYARTASGGGRYWSIRIHDWPFPAHRLAWLYMTGQWPEAAVDHRDMNGLNNRWDNLRAATKSQNAANTKLHARNTTGRKGVSYVPKMKKYRASIFINGRQKWLGYFESVDLAHQAYAAAATEKSGEFARST